MPSVWRTTKPSSKVRGLGPVGIALKRGWRIREAKWNHVVGGDDEDVLITWRT